MIVMGPVCSFDTGMQGIKQKVVGKTWEATILEAGEGGDFILLRMGLKYYGWMEMAQNSVR